jgi:hypothetical protein
VILFITGCHTCNPNTRFWTIASQIINLWVPLVGPLGQVELSSSTGERLIVRLEEPLKFVSRLLGRALGRGLDRQPQNRPLSSCAVEALETRRLFSVSVKPIPNSAVPQDSPTVNIDLTNVFTDNTTNTADLTFSAKSDNTALVQATTAGNNLVVSFTPGASGYADLTIGATAPDFSVAFQQLRIHVTPSPARTLDVDLGPQRRSVTFVQSDQTLATITLSGPGTGVVEFGGDQLSIAGQRLRGLNQDLQSITLSGTTGASSLVITGVARKRRTVFANIGDITSDGALGTLRIKNAVARGDVSIAGGVRVMNVDFARQGQITLGGSAAPLIFTLSSFTDENLTTSSPIATINAMDWVNSDSVSEALIAPYISRLHSTYTFGPGVQLSGTGAPARTLGFIRVGGTIGGTWMVAGPSAPLLISGTNSDFDGTFDSLPYMLDRGSFTGTLTVPTISSVQIRGEMFDGAIRLSGSGKTLGHLFVRGVIVNSVIVSNGNLGPISAAALQNSVVFAGVGQLAQGQQLPQATTDFATAAVIQSISLHPNAKTLGFFNSDIAAATIGSLALSTTRTSNNQIAFGVAGESIGRITAHDLTTRRFIVLRGLTSPDVLAQQIAAQHITLTDMVITVVQ